MAADWQRCRKEPHHHDMHIANVAFVYLRLFYYFTCVKWIWRIGFGLDFEEWESCKLYGIKKKRRNYQSIECHVVSFATFACYVSLKYYLLLKLIEFSVNRDGREEIYVGAISKINILFRFWGWCILVGYIVQWNLM